MIKTNSNFFQCYIFFGSVRVLPKTADTSGHFSSRKKKDIITGIKKRER